ncbi:putative Hsc70 cochaperone [Phyllosticta citrichinensis]|uniref:Hsc70 cochaperone n=1 Tax=Phyllosticta citrichinensis TaxID=1130410 RepID=A0ABR1XUV0_9PEZI
MAPSASQKRLALAIIDFLHSSTKDGTLAADEAENIEIATNCVAEAFGVDASDSAAVADALGGQNLLSIYSVYEKLKGRTTPSTEGGSSAKEGRPSTPTAASAASAAAGSTDADKKAQAEKLKGQGNAAMQRKDYDAAIALYTQALELAPLQPIYLSNRAAAHSGAGRHQDAAADAEMAVAADPNFAKAWSRLGLARFALGDAKGSMEAYQKGIEAEGNGGSEAMKRGFETAKRRVEELGGDVASPASRGADAAGAGAGGAGGFPDLAGLSSMLGGGAGGQGGGMPDLSQLMQNPMMRQMAQNLMSNPDAMQGLLNNPRLREMAGQFGGGGGGGGAGGAQGGQGGGGGGMPDFSQMMQDPSIMEMARNLMGGGGAGGAPGAGRGGAGQGQ